MNVNSLLFDKLKNIHKLPNNRRQALRRTHTRRKHPTLSSNDRRMSSDRRLTDRRAIKIEFEVKDSFVKVSGLLKTFEIASLAFPNLQLIHRRNVSQFRSITDWRIKTKDGYFEIQTENELDQSGRFLIFQQCKGDFQHLSGSIEVSPEQNGTKFLFSVLVEPGLPSFEAILGNVFKRKIQEILEKASKRLSIHFGGEIEKKCDFGFLIHTIPDYFVTSFSDTTYAKMPECLSNYLLGELPPFKAAHVTGIKSIQGTTSEGTLIFSPYTPAHFLNLNREKLFNHIVEAGEIAKNLGAKIIGLGAYTAFVGKRGIDLAAALSIPITTGTSYTIATALMALEQAALNADLPLSESSVTIVGATGSIGKACAELLAPRVRKLILVARNLTRLKDLVNNIEATNPKLDIFATNDLQKAFTQSSLVMMSTNTPETFIDIKDFQPGTIICDISQPRNIAPQDANRRNDILVIDGGVVEPPGRPNFNIYFGLPPGLTYACLGETIILSLEKRFESFSIGGNITASKINEIAEMGKKHGFKLADLKSFGNLIPKEKFNKVASSRILT